MQCERCSSDHTVFASSRWLIVRVEELRDGGTTRGQYPCDTAPALSRLLVGHPQPRFEKKRSEGVDDSGLHRDHARTSLIIGQVLIVSGRPLKGIFRAAHGRG